MSDPFRTIRFPPGGLAPVFSLGGGNAVLFRPNFSGNILCDGQPGPAVVVTKEPSGRPLFVVLTNRTVVDAVAPG